MFAMPIARASRNKTEQGRQKMKKAYRQLLEITSRVVGQAKKFSHEIAQRVKRGNLSVMHKAKKQLDQMIPRVQQVLRQTRERVLHGNTRAEGKLLSIFETHTEVIRKGKAISPMSSANWSCFKRPRTRSSRITKYANSGQPIPPCWRDVWSNMSNSSDGPRNA